jgi:hypothetical protein
MHAKDMIVLPVSVNEKGEQTVDNILVLLKPYGPPLLLFRYN